MNLNKLSDKILLENTKALVEEERSLTLQVLRHLCEVERRMLFAKLGFSSLFEYAVRELKYSEGAAQRRISSMRLLKSLPEIEQKVEQGTMLSLSALSQAQSFFKHEKLQSSEEKREVLQSLEGKSTREVERELVSRSSEPAHFVKEKLRAVSETHTELKILVDTQVLNQIEELRGLLAHSHPGASIKEVISFAIGTTLNRIRPKLKTENQIKSTNPPPAPAVTKRYIAARTRQQVWERDGGQCTYTHDKTGHRCTSNYALEIDHAKPFAVGGTNELNNLRLRCRVHNQFSAIETFGQRKMAQFIPRLQNKA